MHLILMMLSGWGRVSAADARSPGRVCRERVRAADARDAGQFWGVGQESGQLMLMMLAGFGGVGGLLTAADAHAAGRAWRLGKRQGR